MANSGVISLGTLVLMYQKLLGLFDLFSLRAGQVLSPSLPRVYTLDQLMSRLKDVPATVLAVEEVGGTL